MFLLSRLLVSQNLKNTCCYCWKILIITISHSIKHTLRSNHIHKPKLPHHHHFSFYLGHVMHHKTLYLLVRCLKNDFLVLVMTKELFCPFFVLHKNLLLGGTQMWTSRQMKRCVLASIVLFFKRNNIRQKQEVVFFVSAFLTHCHRLKMWKVS